MLKNMQHFEEVCNVTLVSQDTNRIRAHKLVLASVSTPSGTCLWIYERSIWVQSYILESTIEDSRKWFETRFGLQAFAGNFSHNQWFAKTDWLCRCKISVKTKDISCPDIVQYMVAWGQFGDIGGGQESGRLLHGSTR